MRRDRLIFGALIAGAICFVSDGFLHQQLLTAQWEALQAASGAQVREHGGWAGVVSWLAFSVAAPAQFIPIGYFSNELWVLAGAYQLVVSVLAAIAGAAVYHEP